MKEEVTEQTLRLFAKTFGAEEVIFLGYHSRTYILSKDKDASSSDVIARMAHTPWGEDGPDTDTAALVLLPLMLLKNCFTLFFTLENGLHNFSCNYAADRKELREILLSHIPRTH